MPAMNVRFIEAFVWVARLRSFTAAADKLGATQTAISARISSLEDDFGVKLFVRDPRGVSLTAAGEELLKHAEQVLDASSRMHEAASQRAAGNRSIAIGIIEAIVHTWLPDLLIRLRECTSNTRVELHAYTSFDLHEELLSGRLDVAFTSEFLVQEGIVNSPICHFPMAWIGLPSETVAVAKQDRPILTFLRDSFVYRDVVGRLGLSSVTRIHPTSSIAAMVALVRTGYGVATLPPAAIRPAIDAGDLAILPGGPGLTPIPVIANRRRHHEGAVTEVVVRLAQDAAAAWPGAEPVASEEDHHQQPI
jgi:DNA-binding transcriptional LysR family regulator